MKVLLVEDSPTLRHAMSAFISAAGHEALIAEDGEKALQILENSPVEMIIMDVEMPGLNGFETTKLIREILGNHWIPIIFVTGKADDASVEKGIEAGGDDYLVKPVSQVILNAKIRAMERIISMRNELAELNLELKALSQYDSLTQLFNRRTFTERAHEQWRSATRSKEPFTTILLDIDHFKFYNDKYGHPKGDECIRQVAAVLKESVCRPNDVVARYGGEEFIAILPNTDTQGAKHVCELIRSKVEDLAIEHSESLVSGVVTMSIGASVTHFTTGTDLDDQIVCADQALYESKNNGRNQCIVNEYTSESRILIVDDCSDTINLISEMLMGHCKTISTTDGKDVLTIAREFRPDIILLDFFLPNFNGDEVCEQLREDSTTSSIPVILVSGSDKSDLKRLGKMARANAFIQKPIEPNQLIAKISRFLS